LKLVEIGYVNVVVDDSPIQGGQQVSPNKPAWLVYLA
jgi:hypothetical protein